MVSAKKIFGELKLACDIRECGKQADTERGNHNIECPESCKDLNFPIPSE